MLHKRCGDKENGFRAITLAEGTTTKAPPYPLLQRGSPMANLGYYQRRGAAVEYRRTWCSLYEEI